MNSARTFSVYWERRANIIGVVQVEEITENGQDVTHLARTGPELWFQANEENRVEALRDHLARMLACSIDEIEIEEPDEEEVNGTNAHEFK